MPRQRHDPTKSLVGFLVGDVAYAVRIDAVREIVNPLDVVALPRAAASVRGVASFRGEVVPVVDLRERFGLPSAPATRKSKWIVVDTTRGPSGASSERPSVPANSRFVALAVDTVTGVFGTGGKEIRPSPSLGQGDDVRGLEGVTTIGDTLVFVLGLQPFRAIAAAVASDRPGPSSDDDGDAVLLGRQP